MPPCLHEPAGYDGRCPLCGTRLVIPSQQLQDFADANGMRLVEYTVTIRVTAEMLARLSAKPRTF